MNWYWYYLIIGLYVAFCLYFQSFRYKTKNPTYISRNPRISWNWLWQIPVTILIWWVIVMGMAYDMMLSSHTRQKLKRAREEIKKLKDPIS